MRKVILTPEKIICLVNDIFKSLTITHTFFFIGADGSIKNLLNIAQNVLLWKSFFFRFL